jgi:ribosomal protein L37AE/L43A
MGDANEKETGMNKVFAVQELKRYHCPKCDGTYVKRNHMANSDRVFICKNERCRHEFDHGVAKPVHSLTEASVYGDIEVLVQTNNVGIALQPMVAQLKSRLKDFDDTDYILPVGDPVLIGMVAKIAADANRGRVNFLRWDRQTRSYIKIGVTL